jgi:hypothetical protein
MVIGSTTQMVIGSTTQMVIGSTAQMVIGSTAQMVNLSPRVRLPNYLRSTLLGLTLEASQIWRTLEWENILT